MFISHECPIDLLDNSSQFNDYEYSLLHLLHIPGYKDYYKMSNRMHIMDNSAYEYQFIEGGFDVDYYVEMINEVRPTHIIIPDVISDTQGTIDGFESFPFDKLEYNPKTIGVVQGRTTRELNICFDYMNEKADVVALVFHSKAYHQGDSANIDYNNMMGRYKFFSSIKDKLKNPCHLLGCSLPQEFMLYGDEPMIQSIDTANPVQFGILGDTYPEDFKLVHKPRCVLSEEIILGDTPNKDIIFKNIEKFRRMVKCAK